MEWFEAGFFGALGVVAGLVALLVAWWLLVCAVNVLCALPRLFAEWCAGVRLVRDIAVCFGRWCVGLFS